MSNFLRPHGLYSPWNSSGQNTGVGSLSVLQGIFNPGIEPRSPILQVDSLSAEPPGKPKNTGVWVAYPFSSRSSQLRNQTQVSLTAGGFFTSWATREAQEYWCGSLSLLQQIFPTQESNRGLLRCRRILYQLSSQGSTHHSYLFKICVAIYTCIAAINTCMQEYMSPLERKGGKSAV